MLNLESAFNYVINLKGRDMELHDLDTDTRVTVKVAKSNYFRNFEGMEEMVITGREFVVSKKSLDALSFTISRNTRIIDPLTSTFTVTEVEEMDGLGNILGYRLRTS